MKEPIKTYFLFVGTYTDSDSEGIYKYTFDSATGKVTDKVLAASLDNPSFLKISPDMKTLYAVQETDNYDSSGGAVTTFKIENGLLREINTNGTGGAHPCHIGISEDGRLLAVSNYTGGNFSIFNLGSNGGLLSNPQIVDHKVLDTTKTSHVHSVQFTKDGLFVADLGLDAIKRYTQEEKQFFPTEQASIGLPEKAGPRHFAFDKEEKFLYVINELNSTVTVFERNAQGKYNELSTQSTLDPDFMGDSYCADIHLSRDGKFLYGSNRGENTIVIFKVDKASGRLSVVGRESVQGNWPRNFAFDPTDNFLLVANQKSNNISVFKRNTEEGTLNYLHEINLPSPVCLEFMD